jgi:hypothetical protein
MLITMFASTVSGQTVTVKPTFVPVTEGGSSNSYTVVLDVEPTADVVIQMTGDEQVIVSPTMLTFTSIDFNTPKPVMVTAVDDDSAEGSHPGFILHSAESTDPNYAGADIANVIALITDNDVAGVTVSQTDGTTEVTEGGAGDTYTLVLDTQPAADVTIVIGTSFGEVTAMPAMLTFTSANWNVARTVTVEAIDDSDMEGLHADIITHLVSSADSDYNRAPIGNVDVNITDNDSPGFTISAMSVDVTEGGTDATYTIRPNTAPGNPVTVNISGDADVFIDPPSLIFTSGDFATPQTVTVTAVDDGVIEGDHTGTISHTVSTTDPVYTGLSIGNVTANITDNDAPGVDVVESGGTTSVSEAGTTDTYTVVLTSMPTDNVVINISAGTQLQVNPSMLTFQPGTFSTPQMVTVSAVDDSAVEGAHTGTITHTASSNDSDYDGIAVASLTANITDNDMETPVAGGVSLAGLPLSIEEGGANDTYSIVLTSAPASSVTINVDPDGESIATPGTVVFSTSNWNTAQEVTIIAFDDSRVEGDHNSTIGHTASSNDAKFNNITIGSAMASITDNDNAGITLLQTSGDTGVTEGGNTDSYALVLTSQPASSVNLEIEGDEQITLSATTLSFTASNWNIPQTVTVSAINDNVDENVATQMISHTVGSADSDYDGLSVPDVTVTVNDNDTAGVFVSETNNGNTIGEDGLEDSYSVVLGSQPTADVLVTPVTDDDIGVSPDELTFTSANWNMPQTVTLSAIDDDLDKEDEIRILNHDISSQDDNYDGFVIENLEIFVTDNDEPADDGNGGGPDDNGDNGAGQPLPNNNGGSDESMDDTDNANGGNGNSGGGSNTGDPCGLLRLFGLATMFLGLFAMRLTIRRNVRN